MICVDIHLLYVKWIPNGAIVPDHITQSAEVIGKGVKTQTDRRSKHWNLNFLKHRDRNTDQTGWRHISNTSALFCFPLSVHLSTYEQYISHMYSVRTMDNLTLLEKCVESSHHTETSRAGKGKTASRQQAGARWASPPPDHTELTLKYNHISLHKKINLWIVQVPHLAADALKAKHSASSRKWKQKLTWWILCEDRQSLTSHWLHGERVLARRRHRLIFYTLNHSQLFVQSERHLERAVSTFSLLSPSLKFRSYCHLGPAV